MPYSGEKSIADVAQSICRTCAVHDGDVLVGASLGGRVACEITKIRRIRGLYLIGSAVRKEEISRLIATLRPLARLVPFEWLRFSAGKLPSELAQMFAGVETSFILAMCSAIFEWEGLGASETRVFRIHGRRDLVIPPPAAADLFLNGGHLIAMTHAAECVAFIQTSLPQAPTPAAEGTR